MCLRQRPKLSYSTPASNGQAPGVGHPSRSSYSNTLRAVAVGGFHFREHQVIGWDSNPAHEHEYQCIGFLVAGLGEAQFGREQWSLRPGCLNIVPAGVRHVERFGTREVRWCGIELPSVREDYAAIATRVFDHHFQLRGGVASHIAARIYRELRTADEASALALHGLGLELLATLARTDEAYNVHSKPRWLPAVQDYLHARFLEDFSLDAVAREAQVHPTHLARTFRRILGVTVGEYVRNMKIDHSLAMLLQGMPIAQIAQTAGFSDQAHFTRAFKRRLGVPPAEYRRRQRSR